MDNYARDLIDQRLSKVNKDLEAEEQHNFQTRQTLDQSNLRVQQLKNERENLIDALKRIPD